MRALFIPARIAFLVLLLSGCQKDHGIRPVDPFPGQAQERLDIRLGELMRTADFHMEVQPRNAGYTAFAKGRGRIPAGEYAGWPFQITIEAEYSGIGIGSLISGSAIVKIRGEHFISFEDPALRSFCCGEGHLLFIDGEWIFTVFGRVMHTSRPEPHEHLFAGLARSTGTMNMHIANQSGTVVDPADPPHDPDIGLIIGFDALRFVVEE